MRKLLMAIVSIGLISACGAPSGGGLLPSPIPSSTFSPSPAISRSPTPSPRVTPSPTPPSGYVRTAVSGGATGASTVTDVRVGQHAGYDRFVIEFGGGIPIYSVRPQSTATFVRSPKGDRVTLAGTSGVLIVVHVILNWTSYSGRIAFKPGYPYLKEALQVENFEGYQAWAIGIKGTAYVHVSTLSAPSRLVVDVVGI